MQIRCPPGSARLIPRCNAIGVSFVSKWWRRRLISPPRTSRSRATPSPGPSSRATDRSPAAPAGAAREGPAMVRSPAGRGRGDRGNRQLAAEGPTDAVIANRFPPPSGHRCAGHVALPHPGRRRPDRLRAVGSGRSRPAGVDGGLPGRRSRGRPVGRTRTARRHHRLRGDRGAGRSKLQVGSGVGLPAGGSHQWHGVHRFGAFGGARGHEHPAVRPGSGGDPLAPRGADGRRRRLGRHPHLEGAQAFARRARHRLHRRVLSPCQPVRHGRDELHDHRARQRCDVHVHGLRDERLRTQCCVVEHDGHPVGHGRRLGRHRLPGAGHHHPGVEDGHHAPTRFRDQRGAAQPPRPVDLR